MSSEACCTCATLLSSIPPQYDEKTEKPSRHERRTECCSRAICARCMTDNPRFESYCPYCQISTHPSPLPQGLRDPPAYSPQSSPSTSHSGAASDEGDRPPEYSAYEAIELPRDKEAAEQAQDVLHFVDPNYDSVANLGLRYGVPINVLRRTNGLYSDHLLAARRTVLIPGEYYKGGVSLSPRPVDGEEEEIRKGKVRKWMVACKVADYDIAVLYLKQEDYNLAEAIQSYKDDEAWEKEHPLQGSKGKAKDTRRRRGFGGVSGGLAGQLG